MKLRTLLFACVAGFTAITLPAAVAADADEAEATEVSSVREPGARLQELATRLNLTDEQKEQIAPILRQEFAELKKVREDTSLRHLSRVRRLREITNRAHRQIRALLTPEQQKEYEALRAELREDLKKRAKERREAAQ